MVTEQGGVLNLGVEGIMSISALAAFWVSLVTGSPWLGFLAGGLGGMALSSLHGFVCISCLGNQVVSGLALTILGVGLTHFLGVSYVGLSAPGFFPFDFPLLSQIPVIGDIFFKHNMLVYISFVIPVLFWFFFKRTSLGMHVTATGEMPAAAAAAGLKPIALRYFAVTVGGFIIGLGGAYLSLAYMHLWSNGISGGQIGRASCRERVLRIV